MIAMLELAATKLSDEDEGSGIPIARLEALYNSRKFILNAKQNPARR